MRRLLALAVLAATALVASTRAAPPSRRAATAQLYQFPGPNAYTRLQAAWEAATMPEFEDLLGLRIGRAFSSSAPNQAHPAFLVSAPNQDRGPMFPDRVRAGAVFIGKVWPRRASDMDDLESFSMNRLGDALRARTTMLEPGDRCLEYTLYRKPSFHHQIQIRKLGDFLVVRSMWSDRVNWLAYMFLERENPFAK